jgi:ribokinase
MKKACTIGSATCDLFLLYDGTDVLHLHKKESSFSYLLLKKGAKIDIPQIHKAIGGGATNVAVGLSRLGIHVETYFRTGDDEAGSTIRKTLAQENISTVHCPVDSEHQTALSLIIPSLENDHAALCYRGANRFQTKEQFPLSLLKDLDLLFIGPLSGSSLELLAYVVRAASDTKVSLALNPGMAQLSDNSEEFMSVLPSLDTLIVNKRESGFLFKALLQEHNGPLFLAPTNRSPHLLEPYVHFDDKLYTIKDLAHILLQKGPKTIVVTNGAEGVYVITQEKIYFHPSIPHKKGSSLGAGDAFSSGFLGTQLLGLSMPEAIRYAVINASSVVAAPDAQTGLLSLAALQDQAKKLSPSLLQEYTL